jgi:hypothetical protein
MKPFEIISKIELLQEELKNETEKDEPNTYIIRKLQNKILNLGMMVSYKDIITAKPWTNTK